MSKPSCACGECEVCRHRERNRKYEARKRGRAYEGPPDNRRRFPCRLAALPLDVRLTGARLGAADNKDDAEDLLAAALFPDPTFIGWVAEEVDAAKLADRLTYREWRRHSRAKGKAA